MRAHRLNFTHRPGRHCGSTALHNAMVYHGIDYSEARCFGLACGLGFFYGKLDGMPLPRMIGGRSRTLETDFFEIIQHPWTWNVEANGDDAWRNVAAWIDRDVPVLLRSDLYYLHYYKTSTHFSGHTILLVGYGGSQGDGHALVSDTQFEGVQEVPLDSLDKARSSQEMPMALEYHWHQIERPADLPPLRQMMLRAIRRTAEALLDPEPWLPVALQGVGAIKTLARELPNWAEDLHGDWSWTTRFAYQVIERRGTGGGNFRYLYADYLREVETEIPDLRALGLSDTMQEVGQAWTELSDTFKMLSETKTAGDLFRIAGEQAGRIADVELAFCERILRHVPEA